MDTCTELIGAFGWGVARLFGLLSAEARPFSRDVLLVSECV